MWRLVGVNSKEVYGESEHKSDLHKWMIKNYTKYDGDRKDSIYMDMPEPMRYVRVGTAVNQADILHAAISPIGEQVNFEVEQHQFYVLKNKHDKGYMNQISWNAPKEEAKLFAEKEAALKEAEEIAIGMAKVGIDVEFELEEV